MEIQSGNGEEATTSGLASHEPSGSQVEASDDPVRGEELQAARRIERFHIPLDSLKRMFEKTSTVSSAASSSQLCGGDITASF